MSVQVDIRLFLHLLISAVAIVDTRKCIYEYPIMDCDFCPFNMNTDHPYSEQPHR